MTAMLLHASPRVPTATHNFECVGRLTQNSIAFASLGVDTFHASTHFSGPLGKHTSEGRELVFLPLQLVAQQ
jgi:hypothetical protein